MKEMAQQNGRAIHELAVHTGNSFNQLVQQARAAASTVPIVQNFQTLLQDNRQAFMQQNAFINQNIRGSMPGSSNDPPKPPAVPPTLAIDDRKRESETKPIKKPKTTPAILDKPKVLEPRKAPLAIEDRVAKKPKQAPAIQDIPIKPKPNTKKTNLKQKKVVIEIMDPVKKSNNELKDATKAAVQRILSNKTPSRSKPQIITRDIAGLRRELEDVLEQTAKHRTGMSIKDMEIRRGVKA